MKISLIAAFFFCAVSCVTICGLSADEVAEDYAPEVISGRAPSACLLCDDFEDGNLDPNWTYLKPAWNETGGALVGTPTGRKAVALAGPAFSGCSDCSVQATMQTAGGPYNKLWLLGWYVDKRNTVELLMKQKNGKWILRQRANGVVVSKTKAIAAIDPAIFYTAKIDFDGANFLLSVDGSQLATLPAVGTPSGTVGFQVKSTTGSFGEITVEDHVVNNPPVISDLNATPNPVSGGNPVTVSFTLTDPDGNNISWTASLSEDPVAGGSLNSTSGGPVASGTVVIITYNTNNPTAGTVTIDATDSLGAPATPESIAIDIQP